MKQRLAIIDGIRTPMDKAGGKLKDIAADDLAVYAIKEILLRTDIKPNQIDEVILGNIAQPAKAANVARVAALKAGLPINVPAYTVQRNCASGMEAITSAASKIFAGDAEIILAGGTESMSNIPLFFNRQMTEFFARLQKAKSFIAKLKLFMSFRLSYLKPEIAVMQGLTDPVSGLIMGMTAEVLSREFHITREEQDDYALMSHSRAIQAIKSNIHADEIIPLPLPPLYKETVTHDLGPRENITIETLRRLRPYFDRVNGTVTVGNACPITDGAAAVIVMSEQKAKSMGLKPIGYLRDFSYAALEPERMGLGPVYATSKLLEKTGVSMKDIELIEMNEAFAAQIIANEKAFPSKEFAKKFLNRSTEVGELNRDIMNVNGGAIALGHPVGMTGTRITIHVLKEMRRRKMNLGLATLCVGGGQGTALLLEVE